MVPDDLATLSQQSQYALNDDVLANDGLTLISRFLTDIRRGLDRSFPATIKVDSDIAFVKKFPPRQYSLYLFTPQSAAYPSGSIPALAHIEVALIIDQIVLWLRATQAAFPNVLQELNTNPVFSLPLVTSNNLVFGEAELLKKENRQRFKQVIETLVVLLESLESTKQDKKSTNPLQELIDYLSKADDLKTAQLWYQASQNFSAIRNYAVRFQKTDTDQVTLPPDEQPKSSSSTNIDDLVSVHQARVLINKYIDRLRIALRYLNQRSSVLSETLEYEIRQLKSEQANFEIFTETTPKQTAETEKIASLIRNIDRIVEGFGVEIPASVDDSDSGASGTSSSEQGQESPPTESEAGPQTPPPQPPTTPPEPQPPQPPTPSDTPPPQARQGVVPSGFAFGTTELPTPAQLGNQWGLFSPAQRNVFAYQAISIQAGFLYNQTLARICSLYGLAPLELPPELAYELRQTILQDLYSLTPEQLANLNRFTFGLVLFEKLLYKNPRMLLLIERHIETVAAQQNVPIADRDPLGMEPNLSLVERDTKVRNLRGFLNQTVESDQDPANQQSWERFSEIVKKRITQQTPINSDQSFVAALQSIGIERVPALNIQYLVHSYICASGYDAEFLLTNLNLSQMRILFGNNIPQDQAVSLTKIITAYWTYQQKFIETRTGKSIKPEGYALAEAATPASETTPFPAGNFTDAEIIRIAQTGQALAKTARINGYDARIYLLASLSSPAELADPAYREQLAAILSVLYSHDAQPLTPLEIEGALATIILISREQHAQLQADVGNLAEQPGLMAQIQVHRQASQRRYNENLEAQEVEEDSAISGLAEFDLQARAEIASQILAETSAQNLVDSLSTSEDLGDQQMVEGGDGQAVTPQAQSGGNFVTRAKNRLSAIGKDVGLKRAGVELGERAALREGIFGKAKQLTQDELQSVFAKSAAQVQQINQAAKTSLMGAAVGEAAGGLIGLVNKDAGKKAKNAINTGMSLQALRSGLQVLLGLLPTILPYIGAGLAALGAGIVASKLLSGFGGGAAAAPKAIPTNLAKPLSGTTPLEGGIKGANLGEAGKALASSETGIGAATAAPGIPLGTAAGVGTIAGTGVIAVVASISTHSAFLNPLSVPIQPNEQSKYVSLVKTATPASLANDEADKNVTYRIEITPKEKEDGSGTYRIKITGLTDTYAYLGGKAESEKPTLTSPINLTFPGVPTDFFDTAVTLEYTQNLSPSRDILIQNLVEIEYEVEGETPESTTLKTTASVRVGSPQLGCFEFGDVRDGLEDGQPRASKPWSEAEKNAILQAYLKRAGTSEVFDQMLCSGGAITLYRVEGEVTHGGFRINNHELAFYDTAFKYGEGVLEYSLIHELGHIFNDRNQALADDFFLVGYDPNTAAGDYPCFTYPVKTLCDVGNLNEREIFAEGIALYVVHSTFRFKTVVTGLYVFPDVNPLEYSWYRDNIFGGIEWR